MWLLPLQGARKAARFLQSPAGITAGQLSPDARWMAYVSHESGRNEVYVQAFPQPAAKWQISSDGGTAPRWRRDSRELYYIAPARKLMAVEVKGEAAFRAGAPRELFEMPVRGAYAVSPDGQRFLAVAPIEEHNATGIQVVLNWTSDLRR